MNYLLQYGVGACLLFAIGIILGLGFDKYQDQIKGGIGKMVQAIMEIMASTSALAQAKQPRETLPNLQDKN